MDSWFKNLWKNNKLFFFLLFPLIALIFFKDLILEYLIGSARKMANEAREKDSKLKDEEDKLNNEANKLKSDADRIDEEIKNGKDPGDDWHLK